jgi:hypothetical protein
MTKKGERKTKGTTKICWRCNRRKLIGKFRRNKAAASGIDGLCRTCDYCLTKEWRQKNKVKHNAQQKSLYSRRISENRFYRLKSRYGLTKENYFALVLIQKSKCAICKTPLPKNGRGVHLDHDHKSSKVRGLTCQSCNFGLGGFKDSISNLRAAIKYLKSPPAKKVLNNGSA